MCHLGTMRVSSSRRAKIPAGGGSETTSLSSKATRRSKWRGSIAWKKVTAKCWNIKVRIASARNVCDTEHSRGTFHSWYNFRPFCLLFSFSFYSISISSLHSMHVHYPFASRAHRGQTRIRFLLFATLISTQRILSTKYQLFLSNRDAAESALMRNFGLRWAPLST